MAVFTVAISACASVPADLGRSEVETMVEARGHNVDSASSAEAARELLDALIAAPLTPESAVRIALFNNPGLQSIYATLGFGAADVYEAGRIRNPIFTGAVLNSDAAGERDQVTLGLAVSFTDLLTMHARKRLSRGAFAALQQSIGAEVLATAAKAEKSYYGYIGAQQVAALRMQIAKAGKLSAALAERYRDAGNLTLRELALERAAASATRLNALEAEARAYAARTELAAMLGLSAGAPWSAPAQLRLPLEFEDELDALLALAFESRLDLASARTQTDVLADRLGVVNWTRWLGELDIGAERERETDGVRLSGPTVDWEVPIFNQHQDALLRANAALQIAISEVRRIATDVDNSVRLAYVALENAKTRIAEYRDVMIPQRIETTTRAQEEVNYMLIGIFELIAIKQEEYDAYQGYLEAIRDYWLARGDLSLATGAVLPSSARLGNQTIDVDHFIRPQPGGMDHSGHTMTGKPKTMDQSEHAMKQADEVKKSEHEQHNDADDGGAQ